MKYRYMCMYWKIDALYGESVRKVKRPKLFDSANVIVSPVIDQQCLLLYGVKSAKISANRDTNEDVDVEDEDRTSQMDFQDDHFKNTPPNSTDRDSRPITKQFGFFYHGFLPQETARKLSYTDYVNIEKTDYETLMGRQEGKHGTSLKHLHLPYYMKFSRHVFTILRFAYFTTSKFLDLGKFCFLNHFNFDL